MKTEREKIELIKAMVAQATDEIISDEDALRIIEAVMEHTTGHTGATDWD